MRAHEALETRVAQRTQELANTKLSLQAEVAVRKRAEAALCASNEELRRVTQ